jgi:transposase InsO family protein
MIDRWRLAYNHRLPHSALEFQTPAAFAAGLLASVRAKASHQQAGRTNANPLIQAGT